MTRKEDGITIHPRYYIVRKAAIELSEAMSKIIRTHDLTHAEVTSILVEECQSWNAYAIREERRQADEKEGGSGGGTNPG
jgi:hypothetical protein